MYRTLTRNTCPWRSAFALALGLCLFARYAAAEEPNVALKTLKGDITEARNIQRVFADGLKYCPLLDGTRIYNRSQKRIVPLSDIETSLQNLVNDRLYNQKKKRPWTAEDADEILKSAHTQAGRDRYNCNLVAKLPDLLKELAAIESRPQ